MRERMLEIVLFGGMIFALYVIFSLEHCHKGLKTLENKLTVHLEQEKMANDGH